MHIYVFNEMVLSPDVSVLYRGNGGPTPVCLLLLFLMG